MIPPRAPDYISRVNARYWFDEMIVAFDTEERALKIDRDGALYCYYRSPHSCRCCERCWAGLVCDDHVMKNYVQEAYRAWQTSVIENAMQLEAVSNAPRDA